MRSRSLGSMLTGTTPSSTISRRAACDGATYPRRLLLSATLFVQNELSGGTKSQSPTTDYVKAREVGNGYSRNQSTRHSSGSRCDLDHSARCLLGQHRPQQYQGELRVMERPIRGGSYYRQRFLCRTN